MVTYAAHRSLPLPALVGRERELDRVDALLSLGPDESRVLVLEGDPGIGKSALLHVARSLASERGFNVLGTAGVEAESRVPFAALHQLLAGELGQAEVLPDPDRTALLVCFGLSEGARPGTFLIAQAATMLLRSISIQQPVLMLVDDLQWVDPASLDVLTLMARRLMLDPVALVASVRTGYNVHLPESFAMRVSGLDADAAAEILGHSAPGLTALTRELILSEAEGNPLALLELPFGVTGRDSMRHTPEGKASTLSDRLERAFTARLSELPLQTRDGLLLMALDSGSSEDELLEALGRLSGRPAHPRVWKPALSVGLLRNERGTLVFRHPLVRSGILRVEPLTRRQAAHRALADEVGDPFSRTWHLAQSIIGPDEQVAQMLEDSARSLAARGALMPAVTNLERAAQLTRSSEGRAGRLLSAAQHAFELGRADLVGELLESARRGELTELQGAKLEWLREILHDGNPGDAARVFELCDWAGRSAAASNLDLSLDLLLGAALRCWWADTGPQARARVADVLDTLDARHDPRFVAALAVAEPVMRAREVLELLTEVVPLTVDTERGDVWRLLGMAAHAVGDSPRAAVLLDRAEAALRRDSQHGLLAQVWSMQVIVRLELGNLGGAMDAVEEGLRLARLTGQPIWNTGTLVCAARAEAMRGNTEKAFDLATRAELQAAPARLNDLMACVAMARGIAHLDSNDPESAYLCFRSLFEPSSPHFHQRQRFDGVMFLARSAALAGQVEEARSVVSDLELVAAVTPAPLLHAHLLYARAVLADDVSREHLFLTALNADLAAWPWVRGQTLVSFGRWLATQGRYDEAKSPLREGQRLFERTGAVVWAAEAGRSLQDLKRKAAHRDHQ